MDAGGIVGLVFAFLATWILLKTSLIIVHQAEAVVIERLGRFKTVLGSGIHFIVPFIDRPRPFTWTRTYIDVTGRLQTGQTSDYRIDLRESVFNFPRQDVYSRDTVSLSVNSIMYYRIYSVRKAVYEVEDLQTAIANVAQSQIKEIFGQLSFSEALQSQERINAHMRSAFSARFASWGVVVERMELLDMTPKGGSQISASMKKQMIAERERRAEFIRAEGEKSAMRLRADGYKAEKANIGVAEQEALRKRSEGSAGAKVAVAEAESRSLELLHEAVAEDGVPQTDYMLSMAFLKFMRSVGTAVKRKTIYLPYEFGGLQGVVSTLSGSFGAAQEGRSAARGPRAARAAVADRYDDLS